MEKMMCIPYSEYLSERRKSRAAIEFVLKTAGKSEDPSYTKDPDYWHDMGWEKELEKVMKEIERK